MKKSVFRLICLICILAFVSVLATSCTERERINNALEKTNNLESLDCDLYWKVKIKDGTYREEYSVQEKLLINKNEMLVTSFPYGSDEKSTIYTNGKSVYLDNGEAVDLEEYNSKNVSLDNSLRGLLTAHPKQLFDLARVDNINGKTKLSVELESVPFRAVLDKFLTGIEKKLDMEKGDGVTVEYSDCSLEILVAEGYVYQVNVSFNVEKKTDDDVSKEVRLTLSLNINEPGKEVSVNKP